MESRFLRERRERHEREAAKFGMEESILKILPDDLPQCPTISNATANPGTCDVHGWLSFNAPSWGDDRENYSAVAILRILEAAGWQQLPATLCRWDNYRPSPAPGVSKDIPNERGRYKLHTVWQIAPLWFKPCQFTCQEAELYMQAPDGRRFFVNLDTPTIPVGVFAQRKEYIGGWYYERGTAKTHFPKQWHSHPHCKIGTVQQAVDTEQGISGAVFFEPHNDQLDWPMTASEFLQSLIDLAAAKVEV